MYQKAFAGLCIVMLSLAAVPTEAQIVREVSTAAQQSIELTVPLYKSKILSSTTNVERVSIGNPDIADIVILRSRELYVLGKDLGSTNVLLWDTDNNLISSIGVEVVHDLDGLKEKLFQLMPNEQIEVRAAQRSIVLSGSVSSIGAMNAALSIAEGYLAQAGTAVEEQMFEQEQGGGGVAGEVINLMQVSGAQQVMLEVKVAEIARSELRKFDMQFNSILNRSSRWNVGSVSGGASFPDLVQNPETFIDPITGNPRIIPGTAGRVPVFSGDAPWGPAVDEFAPNPLSIENTGFFASLLTGNALVNMSLDAARDKGLAKILAEPTLTTLSGQEAQFLSGGEFPIPVPRGDDGVTVEFKEFGVGLSFVPVVLGSGQINMTLAISVSELVTSNSVAVTTDGTTSTFVIPSLTKRSAGATVELSDGQTMGIAGLINENLREVVTKFPGLGSIPLLGHLFRSQEFIKGETELVILVTPHLARPLRQDDIRLPTDNFIEPNTREFYLMGKLEGKPRETETSEETAATTNNAGGGVVSTFGHQID